MKTRVGLGVLILLVGAATGLYYALRPDFCDGLPREIGACSRSRPVFTGATCSEVGTEWGRQLDERVVPLIRNPRQGMSSKLLDAEILTIQLANKHMRDNGITPTCTVDGFFLSGEAELSSTFKGGIANVFIEHEVEPPPTYEAWRERSIGMVELILSVPDGPYNPYDP